MEITKSATVARYIELEELHNKTIQELNTSYGGAVSTIWSYEEVKSTTEKFNKNADFMLKRLNQINILNSTIKELNDLLEAGVLDQVHDYYKQLRDSYKDN